MSASEKQREPTLHEWTVRFGYISRRLISLTGILIILRHLFLHVRTFNLCSYAVRKAVPYIRFDALVFHQQEQVYFLCYS